MYGIIRYISVLGAIAIAVAGLSACGGGSGDVVARVGEYAITRAAFDHWLSIRAATSGQTAVSDRTALGESPKQKVLGFLIFSQWTIGEAAELGVRVSEEEAQRQLELFKYDQLEGLGYGGFRNAAELRRSLAGSGETHSDQLWLMKLSMLAARIEQVRLSEAERQITNAQIAQYYDEDKQRFVLPERRDIEVIATFNNAADEGQFKL